MTQENISSSKALDTTAVTKPIEQPSTSNLDLNVNFDFQPSWDYLSSFLSSAFSIAALGSAFGAFGGAYCLWLINKKREHEHSLSQINTVLALLIAHMNSLLNFKKQHVLPFNKEMCTSSEYFGHFE